MGGGTGMVTARIEPGISPDNFTRQREPFGGKGFNMSNNFVVMSFLKLFRWAIIFQTRLLFPPGVSIAKIIMSLKNPVLH